MAVKVRVKDSSEKETGSKIDNKVTKKAETKTKTECCCCDKKDVPVYTDETGFIHVNKEYAKEFPEITLELVKSECRKSERCNECYINKWENDEYCCCDKDDCYTEDYENEFREEDDNEQFESKLLTKIIKYLNSHGYKVKLEEITNI